MQFPKPLLKIVLPLGVVLVSVAGVALLMWTKPKPETKVSEEKVWQVRTVNVSLGTHTPTQSLFGQVVSPSQVTLNSALEADVLRVTVKEGQFVAKGTELVVLDDREAKQRLIQRRGELEEFDGQIHAEQARFENDQALLKHEETLLKLSRKTAERLRKLAQQDLGARAQLDEAWQSEARQQLTVQTRRFQIKEHTARLAQLKARHKQAKSRVELAELDLERTRILAPYDGRITKRHVAAGQRVRSGEALVSLYDVMQVEVVAQLPWSLYPKISRLIAEDQVLSGLLVVGDTRLMLTLNRIASQVAAGKGGVDAIFSVQKTIESLQLGRLVNINLILPEVVQSLVLPVEALYGLDKVYRVIDERLQATEVNVLGEIATVNNHRSIVVQSEALTDGDQVLVTKFANAMEGLRVHVMQ